MFKNSKTSYGLLSIALHWITALCVFSLFGVGLWMVGFDYYDPLYKTVPHLHKSFGFLLIMLVVFRFFWREFSQKPQHLQNHKTWEIRIASIVHYALYLLLFCMLPTGYLITTAKGQSLDVFSLFSIPAYVTGVDNLEDLAAEVHEWLAYSIIGIVCLHAVGALKHHFVDKDRTLTRMLRPRVDE